MITLGLLLLENGMSWIWVTPFKAIHSVIFQDHPRPVRPLLLLEIAPKYFYPSFPPGSRLTACGWAPLTKRPLAESLCLCLFSAIWRVPRDGCRAEEICRWDEESRLPAVLGSLIYLRDRTKSLERFAMISQKREEGTKRVGYGVHFPQSSDQGKRRCTAERMVATTSRRSLCPEVCKVVAVLGREERVLS